MDCSRDLTKSIPLKRAPVIFHWSLMCSVQGGNCGTSTKIGFPVAFPKFCGAVTLGQIYGASRSDHYGNLGDITVTGFTKDSWNSMYIAIGT